MINLLSRRPVRLVAVAVAAVTVTMLPGSLVAAAPTTVDVPITAGGMSVNGTVVEYPTVPGATLTGTYDPDTGAFDGRLVIPSFTKSGKTSIDDDFTLTFSAVDAAVTGTIPQSGAGEIGPVGWTVGVELPDYFITDCTVTIAPLNLIAVFDPELGRLALTAVGFTIPGSECTAPVDEADVDAVLAIPTTSTLLGLIAADASALRPPSPEPSFTG